MSGNQTHGYDVLIEFDEDCIKDAISKAVDGQDGSNGLLSRIYDEIDKYFSSKGIPADFIKVNFDFTVSLSIPSDRKQILGTVTPNVPDINPTTNDYVYIMTKFEFSIAGIINLFSSWLEMVIPFGIGPYDANGQTGLFVNLHETYFDMGFNSDLIQYLENIGLSSSDTLKSIKNQIITNVFKTNQNYGLFPLPIVTGTADPYKISNADLRVIRLSSGENLLALLLTMGGGAPGQKIAFNTSAITPGRDMVLLISTYYFCRVIKTELNKALKNKMNVSQDVEFNSIPGLRGCQLSKPLLVSKKDNLDLYLETLLFTTSRSISNQSSEYEFSVKAGLVGYGFCYTARLTSEARISLKVSPKSKLEVKSEIIDLNPNDPNSEIQVNLDIPLYCIVPAVIIGGVFAIPFYYLVEYLSGELVKTVIKTIGDTFDNFIDNMDTSVITQANQVPFTETLILGFDSVLQSVDIDDLGMGYRFRAKELAPVKFEGAVTVQNGDYIDLDKGIITSQSDADLFYDGQSLKTVSNAEAGSIGPIYQKSWKDIARYQLYKYGLSRGSTVFKPGDDPAYNVVKTNTGRLSVVQITAGSGNSLSLIVRTYDTEDINEISGDFSCNYEFTIEIPPTETSTSETTNVSNTVVSSSVQRVDRKNFPEVAVLRPEKADILQSIYNCNTWTPSAIFRAITPKLSSVQCQWYINNQPTNAPKGIIKLQAYGNVNVIYQWDNYLLYLIIDNPDLLDINLNLSAHVTDPTGEEVNLSRNFNIKLCKTCSGSLPTVDNYILKTKYDFGIIEATEIETPWAIAEVPAKQATINFKASSQR